MFPAGQAAVCNAADAALAHPADEAADHILPGSYPDFREDTSASKSATSSSSLTSFAAATFARMWSVSFDEKSVTPLGLLSTAARSRMGASTSGDARCLCWADRLVGRACRSIESCA